MPKQRTPIEKLVESAIDTLSNESYFTKTEIRRNVLKHPKLAAALADIRKRYPGWKFEHAISESIDVTINVGVRRTDAHGIRLYECYAVGNRDRRYMKLRAMNAAELRATIQETRVQKQKLEVKVKVYEYFLDLLEEAGPNARVDDVYDKALSKVMDIKASEGAA